MGLWFSARPQLPQNLLTSTVPQSTQKGILRTGEGALGCKCQGTTGLERRGNGVRRNEGVSSVVDTVLEKLGESSRKLPIKGGGESTQEVYHV